MSETKKHSIERFFYSHYFVTGIRLTVGVLLVFGLVYLFTSALTASVAALGATYVAFVDRAAPMWLRAKEMVAGALLGAMGVTLTGLALFNPVVLAVTMVMLAFFFSMLVVYGPRGATIGLACMTLAIITMPSGLTPDKVVSYSLISLAGALGYIVYSMVSGKLLQMREQRQALSVALYATAQYLRSRANMYAAGIDIDQGYRAMIATQAKMIAAHQGARDAVLGGMSSQSVQCSATRLMIWNMMVDMLALVDLVVSTQTDYIVLHRQLSKTKALESMHDVLSAMAKEIETLMITVAVPKHQKQQLSHNEQAATSLHQLTVELRILTGSGLDRNEPETYSICTHIHDRLAAMQDIIVRMSSQVLMPHDAKPLQPSFLEKSLTTLMSTQSFRPALFVSNLHLQSAAFRYALRVSLAMAIAMTAGSYLPGTGSHGYWISLTVIVIMKPAYSLSKARNANRLVGTLTGCAITFALLQATTDQNVLLVVFTISLLLCFVFFVTSNYRIYSMFMSITVLLALHALLPDSADLPTERAIDTVIGSLIALACSFVLPWWEAKSLPALAANAIKANESLLQATIAVLGQSEANRQDANIAWHAARHDMQIAFSNFAQGFSRMMAEPASKQQHVPEYNSLVVLVHVMAAEIVNVLKQAQANPGGVPAVAKELGELERSLQAKQATPRLSGLAQNADAPMPDWMYALKQLQESIRQVIETSRKIGL